MSAPKIGVRNARGLVRDLSVIAVDRAGSAVVMSEAERLAATIPAIKAAAAPPWQCGDAIPLAVARGPLLRFQPTELVADGKGGLKAQPSGYRCRDGARCADVFDEMELQARRAHEKRGKKAGAFVPPFTWGQVQVARDYAALVERCNASGVKCSSLESLSQSSGSGGDREAAIFADFARLRQLHRRIGGGLAKKMRRHRPSESSSGADRRTTISVRSLVDQVCLAGKAPKEILRDAGWVGSTKQISDLRADLCMALDRMQGYRAG